MSFPFACPHCHSDLEVEDSAAGEPAVCPGCHKPILPRPGPPPVIAPPPAPPPPPVATARRVQVGEVVGVGALVQLLAVAIGAVLCFVGLWLLGVPVILVGLVIGGRMAYVWKCGACRNRIEKDARVCPACHAPLGP